MDEYPKFSIIVPIYNAGQYLKGFIDCVLRQSSKDFEVILVDDGSSDSSGAICDEFARNNCNVKVIHKTNGGVSSARNEGIKHATGDWLLFFDPDDLFDASTIEILKGNLIKYPSVQWIIFNFRYVESVDKVIENNYQLPTNIVLDQDAIKKHIIPEVLKKGNLLRSPWTKAYRREIIVKQGLAFSNRTFAEDYDFNLTYLQYITQVLIIDETLYSYCLHPGTAVARHHSRAIDIWLQDTKRELEMIFHSGSSFSIQLKTEYVRHKISSLAYFLASEQKFGREFSLKLQELFNRGIVKELSGLSTVSIGWPMEHLRQSLLRKTTKEVSLWIRLFRIKISLQNLMARMLKP